MTLKLVYNARALTYEKDEADSVLREMHEVGQENYPLANVLHQGPNKSRKPFSWLPWLIVATIVGEIVLLLLAWRWWIAGNVVIGVIAMYTLPDPNESKGK